MFENADEAIARVEDDVRRAQRRAERYPALQAAIDEVRAHAVSPRRELRSKSTPLESSVT